MKRPKHKVFKRQIDLIRHAIRRAIQADMEAAGKEHAERTMEHMKKNDWVQWAGQKLKGLR